MVPGLVDTGDPVRWLVLDCGPIDDLDYTGGMTLAEVADQLSARGVSLVLCAVQDRVRKELDTFEITPKVGSDHIYETIQDAIEAFHAGDPTAPDAAGGRPGPASDGGTSAA